MRSKPRCEIRRVEVIQAKLRGEKVFEVEVINMCKCRGQGAYGVWGGAERLIGMQCVLRGELYLDKAESLVAGVFSGRGRGRR